MRGIYAAGIFDRCLEEGITFDLGIGVSAGSANLSSFIARQHGRNYKFYTEYTMTKDYLSLRNFLKTRSFMDLEYVYETLSNSDGVYPLDYDAFAANPMDFIIVAEEAETGNARYFRKDEIAKDKYDAQKASSAIPFICKPYVIDGVPYYDGALADPVPVEKAFAEGCDKVVLILTLPEDTVRNSSNDEKFAKRIRKKYPVSAEKLIGRAAKYNEEVEIAREYARQGKLLIVAPDDTCGVSTLTREEEALKALYAKGREDGLKIKEFLEKED